MSEEEALKSWETDVEAHIYKHVNAPCWVRCVVSPLRSRFLQFAVKSEHVRSRLSHTKPRLYAPLENPSKRERTWQDRGESHQNFHTTLELTNVNIGVDKYKEKNVSGGFNMVEMALYYHLLTTSVSSAACFDYS